MAFIGNTNTTQAFTPAVDFFSGNASTTAFTLSRPVASVAQVQAVVNNVAQNPSDAFTVSGNTITFTSAPSSGTNNIYVYYTSPITQVIAPSQGTVGTTQLQNGLTVNFADGTAAAPSITNDGDTNTGIFFPAADTIAFSEGGAEVARFDSSGNLGIGTASPNSRMSVAVSSTNTSVLGSYANIPLLLQNTSSTDNNWSVIGVQDASGDFSSYIGTQNTSQSSNTAIMAFATNGGSGATERMRIDSSGNVGIGTTTTTRAKLNIDTDGSNTSAGYGLALTNLAGGGATWTLQCGDYAVNNGAFTIRQTGISGTTYFKIEASTGYITVPGVYTLTTGSAANVFVGTGGDLRRSTSSLKYKTDIQNATHGLAEVMQLRPVIYKGINDGETVFGGFIAEEVDALGLTEFVQYADDGSPDALAYGNMVSLLAKAIQEQQALITALTERIEALENK